MGYSLYQTMNKTGAAHNTFVFIQHQYSIRMSLFETADQIRTMQIRGAGTIARAAAAALSEYAQSLSASDITDWKKEMQHAADTLVETRPTAVSLPNAVNIVMQSMQDTTTISEAKSAIMAAASSFITSSENAITRIGSLGSHYIRDGDVVLTHCNSQAALACLLTAKNEGRDFKVIATEVRPWWQGHKTIQTLNDAGIRTDFIVDSAVRYCMKEVNLVIVGADAIAVNGAVANKIGTSQIALAAHEARVRFLVAAECYKFAPKTILGDETEIEERNPDEVLAPQIRASLPFVKVRNPVFDITPPGYIDLILTEIGAISPQMAYIIMRDYLGWNKNIR